MTSLFTANYIASILAVRWIDSWFRLTIYCVSILHTSSPSKSINKSINKGLKYMFIRKIIFSHVFTWNMVVNCKTLLKMMQLRSALTSLCHFWCPQVNNVSLIHNERLWFASYSNNGGNQCCYNKCKTNWVHIVQNAKQMEGVSETQKPSYSFSFLHAKGASSVESNAVGRHRSTSVRAQNSLGCELLC